MKIYNKMFVFGLVMFSSLGLTNSALAMTPTLSASTVSNNNVTLTVYGDANSSVNLYYNSGYGLQNAYLGTTNYVGYFTTTLSTSTYNITQGSYVYVIVNNQQSTSVIWPSSYYSNNTNIVANNLVLSNLTLPVLSSATMTLGNGANGIYVSNNSNPSVIHTSIGANINNGCGQYDQYSTLTGQPCYLAVNNLSYPNNGAVTFTALTTGTATVTICQSANYSYSNNNCNTIVVNVTGNNNVVSGSVLGVSTGGSCYLSRTLKYGMYGSDVSCLQTYLINRGYLHNTATNSYFDVNTRNAVVLFQRDNGLFPDGVVGRNTRSLLY